MSKMALEGMNQFFLSVSHLGSLGILVDMLLQAICALALFVGVCSPSVLKDCRLC